MMILASTFLTQQIIFLKKLHNGVPLCRALMHVRNPASQMLHPLVVSGQTSSLQPPHHPEQHTVTSVIHSEVRCVKLII
jgi:hypothetical protein